MIRQVYSNKKALFLLMILFCIHLLSGCSLFPQEEEALTPPLAVPAEITYKTREATIGNIEDSIRRTGYFVPIIEKELFFKNRGGRIKGILVGHGDHVKVGDVVAELLTDGIEREITHQIILVDSREKDLDYTRQLAEIEIRASKDRLFELDDKFQKMSKNAAVLPANDLENLQRELNNQRILVDKLTLTYSNQMQLKENELGSAKLKLAQLLEEMEASKLRAPIAGIVTYTLRINEGTHVDAYRTIVTVSDPNVLHLEYQGESATDFKLGMNVEVKIKDDVYAGEVVLTPASVPVEELEKYRETIRIRVDHLPAQVTRGDRAEVKLIRNYRDNVVIIPRNMVKTVMGRSVVHLLVDGTRVERIVEKGIESVFEVEIMQGIQAGELVIIE